MLAAPAATWWDKAPQGIQQLIDRAEQWRLSVPFLAPARPPAPARTAGTARSSASPATPTPDPVKDKIATESVALTGALLLRAGNAGIFAAATLMLLFFLLASERWLVSRTVEAISKRRSRVAVIGAVRAASEISPHFLPRKR
jgi:predicted PurR-regulated permease PerM